MTSLYTSDDQSSSLNEKIPEKATHVHSLEKIQETHVEGNVQLLDAQGKVRLVPTPTSDPRDPLNWSTWRKVGVYVNVVFFSTMSLSVIGGFGALSPFFFGLYVPQGVDPNKVARLITWPSLLTGLGNWAFLPLSLCLGRRPIFLIASLMLVASSAWAAKSGTSFDSHFAARLVQGFSAGATESLLPLIITDMTYVHQRATAFGIYWTLQNVFTSILNTASTYEAQNLSWQWYYWIFTILSAIGFVGSFFLLPESKFDRPAFAVDGQLTRVDEYGNMVVLSDEEAKQASIIADQESKGTREQIPFIQTLKPFSKPERNSLKIILRAYVDMAKALADPAILWALGASAAALGTNIGISLSFGHILEEDYGWAHANTGLIYLGSIPAGILSFIVSGWLGDKISMYFTRRNAGVHLPEHRLPAMIFPCITGFLAALMYGLCAEHRDKVHWFAIVFAFAWTLFHFVSVLITTTAYAVESRSHHAGAALVMVVGGKNLISFGTATAIVPLANSGRYAYGYSILAGSMFGWILLGVPLYFLMPRYRAWLAKRK
ncbi:hypothetical protein OIV83_002566 [Microbotryomycetes sp. JL201]|nr:hypothetical protein OIV83_002566 [Microbotryomycetes sp. JL201]